MTRDCEAGDDGQAKMRVNVVEQQSEKEYDVADRQANQVEACELRVNSLRSLEYDYGDRVADQADYGY